MGETQVHGRKGPLVIGGGAAGLAACLTLEELGVCPILVEESDRLGGRVRTERMPDGTPVDTGFQVLQAAYPELDRWASLEALPRTEFTPGAMVHLGGRWRTVADPRRAPGTMLRTLLSGVGTWGDRYRVLQLVIALARTPPEDIRAGRFGSEGGGDQWGTPGRWSTDSTAAFLAEWGFSQGFIEDFLRPFFSGIFLERELRTPAAQFHYTFSMLASGPVVRPVGGMAEWVGRMASGLHSTEIRTGCRAEWRDGGGWSVGGEEDSGALGAILTVPDVHPEFTVAGWNACLNVVVHTESRRFGRPIIGLLPGARWVTNFHFAEDVEGPSGRGRLNVTAIPSHPGEGVSEILDGALTDLKAAGMQCGQVQWKAWLPKALPAMTQLEGNTPQRPEGPVFFAGDAASAPSLDAALRSGREAAMRWWAWQEHVSTDVEE